MAEKSVPHFQNSAGLREIRVGAREFMCIGALPPFDHPHVYLDMGSDSEIICPYCSTLYRFDAALKAGTCAPPDAGWQEPDAA
ncbi:zinc-finger domain-containing protein [Rhabdaerophilum sp. SD176]|uniref:zinc-finger domain-containing protein n=1 Tax=Rhabdaerophilum sp. SD176 TaxID=2983548 RepID=UPI0024E003D6|nr:zinc-finger domain-containing protein [Rhabdaerophilum sp. SD176]